MPAPDATATGGFEPASDRKTRRTAKRFADSRRGIRRRRLVGGTPGPPSDSPQETGSRFIATMTTGTTATPLPRRIPVAGWFMVILIAGLGLRLALAYIVFPSQGFATDLEQFRNWSLSLSRSGAGSFYQNSGANYPPGYMYVLWLLGELSGPIGSLLDVSASQATLLLLKLPAIAADGAIAVLLYRAATSWFGGRAGLAAAALYLFVPVT